MLKRVLVTAFLLLCVSAHTLAGGLYSTYLPPPEYLTTSRGNVLRVAEMRITGYTAGFESCGKLPSDPLYGISASSRKVHRGMVAAPRSWPFETILFIPGYGYGVVRDRGGAITEGRLDLYFDTVPDANRWGNRVVKVRILRWGKG